MDISAFTPKPITIELAGRTSFTLRPFRANDADRIELLLDAPDLEPHEFVRAVLQQFADGDPARDLIAHLSGRDLREAAATWARAAFNYNTALAPLERAAFAEFHEATRTKLRRERHRQALLKRLAFQPIDSATLRLLEEARRQANMARDLLRLSPANMEALTRLQRQISPPADLMREVTAAEARFREVMEAARRAADQVSGMVGSGSHAWLNQADAQRFLKSIPDLTQFGAHWSTWRRDVALALEDAENAVNEGGFGFAFDMTADLDWRGTGVIDDRVRKAVITNRVLAMTRSNDFVSEVLSTARGNLLLKRRAPILEAALMSHRLRSYSVSIPALLAQIEGVYTDLLVFKGEAVLMKGKAVPLTTTGQPRMKTKKNGTPQVHPFVGMQEKIQNSELKKHEATHSVVAFMLDKLVSERNAILHGENVTYGKARLSAQLVLALAILCDVLAQAFDGKLQFTEVGGASGKFNKAETQ